MKEKQKDKIIGGVILVGAPLFFLIHLFLFLQGRGDLPPVILYGTMVLIITYIVTTRWVSPKKYSIEGK